MSLYGENRQDHRQVYFDVWHKYQNKQPLEPLEKKILSIVLQHPEFHKIFIDPDKFLDKDYFPELGETNPFVHLSLHLTVLEQIQINRPDGITGLYKKAAACFGDTHEAEHCIMNSLVIAFDDIFKENKSFDEKAYLKRIKMAIKKGYW